mmetsp:Transcript_155290/g.282367  ORF Transcript_155290/g.282367 Transcript_155290/m.282367 type:complete len:226 (+) Transcript_155290:314-991(+)
MTTFEKILVYANVQSPVFMHVHTAAAFTQSKRCSAVRRHQSTARICGLAGLIQHHHTRITICTLTESRSIIYQRHFESIRGRLPFARRQQSGRALPLELASDRLLQTLCKLSVQHGYWHICQKNKGERHADIGPLQFDEFGKLCIFILSGPPSHIGNAHKNHSGFDDRDPTIHGIHVHEIKVHHAGQQHGRHLEEKTRPSVFEAREKEVTHFTVEHCYWHVVAVQ